MVAPSCLTAGSYPLQIRGAPGVPHQWSDLMVRRGRTCLERPAVGEGVTYRLHEVTSNTAVAGITREPVSSPVTIKPARNFGISAAWVKVLGPSRQGVPREGGSRNWVMERPALMVSFRPPGFKDVVPGHHQQSKRMPWVNRPTQLNRALQARCSFAYGTHDTGQLSISGATMNLDDFSMTDEQEEALKEKHEELIENQPEHEPNDGCDGGGCVI